MRMIGVALTSKRSMSGGSVPTGSCEMTVDTLSRTVWAPRSPFFSSLNCTMTNDTPSLLTLFSSSMPSMVLTASSIGLVTVVSISSTEAPRSVVLMVTIGKSMFGKRSSPKRR
jgi:hypothetical protein